MRFMHAAGAPGLAAAGVRPTIETRPPRLTPREQEILELVRQGLRSAAIARRLDLAPCTVESHVRSAMDKLGARTRLHAAALVGMPDGVRGGVDDLDAEQVELLELLAAGYSLAEAARTLHLSPRTAARRVGAARTTLGVRTTVEAVACIPRLSSRGTHDVVSLTER
jgi:DNA-binding NarL/FixJ family response regulator